MTSRLAGSSDARRETTAIDAVGGRPIEVRSRPTVESVVIGPYPSAAAVPVPDEDDVGECPQDLEDPPVARGAEPLAAAVDGDRAVQGGRRS